MLMCARKQFATHGFEYSHLLNWRGIETRRRKGKERIEKDKRAASLRIRFSFEVKFLLQILTLYQ